jgi:hypothetical protein
MTRLAISIIALALAGCAAPAAPVAPAGSPVPSPSPSTGISPSQLTGAFLFYEDFEKGMDRWAIAGPDGPVGWHLLKAYACGGLYSMLMGQADQTPFTAGAGEYTLTLKALLDLTRAKRPHLRYDVKGLATPETAFAFQPEARRPGGDWQPIGDRSTARFVLVNTLAADMTAFAGGTAELRFRVVSRPADAPTKGMYLDDVQVIEPDTTP